MYRSRILGSLAVAGLLASATSQAVPVSAAFNVTSASIPVLLSTSLGDPCGSGDGFFTCGGASPPAGNVAITNAGGGSGVIQLTYESTTGEVTSIDDMNIVVNDMIINILGGPFGTGTVTITQGNGTGWNTGTLTPTPVANDLPFLKAGTGGNGSADADSNAAVNIFEHTGLADFASFPNVIDACTSNPVGVICGGLLLGLSLDTSRYRITGTVSGGTFNGQFRGETQTNANYLVDFTSTVVPVPAAVWLFGSAVGLLGLARRKAA